VFPPTEPGAPRHQVHRFDDPEGGYPVRYLATHLRGALIEVLDQFRTVTATEQRLRQVKGVEGLDILAEETAGRVPEKWLAQQRVGVGHVPAPGDERFLDVMDEDLLAELNLRPRVRSVLSAHPEAFGERARVDFGTIQGSGPAARKLTQAISRELHQDPEVLGIRYISRHTEDEECWAVFEDRVTSCSIRGCHSSTHPTRSIVQPCSRPPASSS
jgi:hypothetical protein